MSGALEQLEVPFPDVCAPRITGPAIARAPDGAIWVSELGGYNALVRIDPETLMRTLYCFGGPNWAKALHLIHFDFSQVRDASGAVGAAKGVTGARGCKKVVERGKADAWRFRGR